MLSFPQQLYVTFKNPGGVKMGEPYIIYRTTTRLNHPNGGGSGYLTHVIGTAKVVRWSDKEQLATLEIVGDWEEMVARRSRRARGAKHDSSRCSEAEQQESRRRGVVAGGRYWFSTSGEHEQLLIDAARRMASRPETSSPFSGRWTGCTAGTRSMSPRSWMSGGRKKTWERAWRSR